MKRLRRWTGEIKNKFLIWMLTIGVVPLILLGTLSFAISYESLMDSYKERIESNLYITQQNLKSLARSVESISRQILASSAVSGAIESTARAGGAKYVDARTQRDLKDALQNILNYTDIPATVYLLDEGGFFFKYINGLATANAGVSLSDYRDSDWYRDTLSMNGLECYFLTNVMTGRSDGYVSVTKLLRDLTTGEPYGILVINISSSELDGLLPPVVEQKGITYVIIDSKGETLKVIGSGAQPASAQALLEKVKGAQGNSIAGYGTETRTGWEIRCLLDSRTVMLANIGIPLLTLFFALGLVILSLACSLLAARSITQPLKRLGVGIEKMRAGARLDIGPFGDDEVGRIGKRADRDGGAAGRAGRAADPAVGPGQGSGTQGAAGADQPALSLQYALVDLLAGQARHERAGGAGRGAFVRELQVRDREGRRHGHRRGRTEPRQTLHRDSERPLQRPDRREMGRGRVALRRGHAQVRAAADHRKRDLPRAGTQDWAVGTVHRASPRGRRDGFSKSPTTAWAWMSLPRARATA